MFNREFRARCFFGILILVLTAASCANFPPRQATEAPLPTDTPLSPPPVAEPTSTPTPLPPPPTNTLVSKIVAIATSTPTTEVKSEDTLTATPPPTSTPPPPPPPTPTPQPTELLINGSFEEGFGVDGVAVGWSKFSNDHAGFVWYDDRWSLVVLDGEHSQLISIVDPNRNDRYIGIYQTVDVVPGQAYELTLRGLVRANTPEEQYGHRLYWGADHDGSTDWQAVENWTELPWDQQPLVTDAFTINEYTTVITPTGQLFTLFIRGHSKWPRRSEANFNLDNLSFRGVPGAGADTGTTMPVTGKREINWVPIVALIALLLIFFREIWRGVARGFEV